MGRGIAALPRLAEEAIVPERLIRRLSGSQVVSVLRAPAGFGKTTVAASWLADDPDMADAIVVWRHISSTDRDSEIFWKSLATEFDDAGIDVPAAHSPRAAVERAIRRSEQQLVIVIDALDNVEPTGVDEPLADLVRASPLVQLVVCLRDPDRFPREWWGDLDGIELGAADLRLTRGETAAVLAEADVVISDDEIDAVHATLRGWPRAVGAFARRMTLGGDARTALDAVHNDIRRQVIGLFDEHGDRALLPLALLDHITPNDLAALGLPPDEWRRLAGLAQHGLIVADGAPSDARYRWTTLTKQILYDELHRRGADELPALHQRLARHYGAEGSTATRALKHAVLARDWREAVRIVEGWWSEIVHSGQLDDLHRTLAEAPTDLLRSPRIIAAREMSHPGPRYRETLLKVALPRSTDRLERLAHSPHAERIAEDAHIVGIGLRVRDLLDESAQHYQRLLYLLQRFDGRRPERLADRIPGVHHNLGTTLMLKGDLTAAAGHLEQAYRRGGEARHSFTRRDAAAKRALLEASRGEVMHARRWITRAEAEPEPDLPVRELISASIWAARVLSDVDALASVQIAEPPDSTSALSNELWMYAVRARSRAALAHGDRLGALRTIAAERHKPRDSAGGSAFARELLFADEIDLLIAIGSASRAARRLETTDEESAEISVRRARLAMHAGDWDTALEQSAAALAAETGWPAVEIEALLIMATGQQQIGDRGAIASMQMAAERALGSGCVRPFAALTDEVRALAESVPRARELLARPEVRAAEPAFVPNVNVVVLTDREDAVLRGLDSGETLPEIAQAHFVSINTIKTQVRQLYRKLDAGDRTDALRRARVLGLL